MNRKTLFLSLAEFIFIFLPHCANATEGIGKFTNIKGNVHVASVNGTGIKDAVLGGEIFEGDTVNTDAGSTTEIVMNDDNVIHLGTDTKLTIKSYIPKTESTEKVLAKLNLHFGEIHSDVNQKYDSEQNTYRVETETAVVGVRGTQFVVNYDPKAVATNVTTVRGEVSAGTSVDKNGDIADAIPVKAGKTSKILKGAQPTRAVAAKKSELKRFKSQYKRLNARKKRALPEGRESRKNHRHRK